MEINTYPSMNSHTIFKEPSLTLSKRELASAKTWSMKSREMST